MSGWSSARRAVVPSELVAFARFLYSVRDCGTLCYVLLTYLLTYQTFLIMV